MWQLPELTPSRPLRRLAVLTSGGDAPGMNAAIRAVVRYAVVQEIEVFAVNRGFAGLIEGDLQPMRLSSVANTIQRGGTFLKSGRCEAFREPDQRRQAAEQLAYHHIQALVVIGGDGSLTGAHVLAQETGLAIIGVPATIDNDIYGSDDTVGFDTAVNTALEATDRIRDTADSHERTFVAEVMGRTSGFIATQVGIASGAEAIVLPDRPLDRDALYARLSQSTRRGKASSLIVVAEGEHPGQSSQLADELTEHGHQSRACILGHIQRGGSPTGHDRTLASTLGALSIQYLMAGYSDAMVAVQNGAVTTVDLGDVVNRRKPFPEGYLELANILAT